MDDPLWVPELRHRRIVEEKDDLIRRAAELLFWPAQHLEANNCIPDKQWFKDRDQWLRDAGWEKK